MSPLPALPKARPRVIRNALLLVGAQAVATPIAVLVNAVAARALGPVDYGRLFLAMSYSTFAFLFVEWGQSHVMAGKVAIDRARAGELLGSGLLWRIAAAAVVSCLLPAICALAGYDQEFLFVLGLMLLTSTLVTVSAACQDAFRGFERTDFAAASYVGFQLLSAAAAVPTLLLGGGIRGLLVAQALCAALGVIFVLKMLPRMRVPKLTVRTATVWELFSGGRAFLAFAVVLALQPIVDSAMLSKFGSADSLGWYAAARRLTGVLIYPAAALGIAAFPTLSRLHVEDAAGFRKTAADAFHMVTLVVMPVALGCALFPQLGVMIFGERFYGPAEDDLRVLAVYVLLVYFSMTLSTCLTSSGRQVGWTVVQFLCVLISIAGDPPLILWFQAHSGNGSLGVCMTSVLSEVVMLVVGLYLLPKGILNKALLHRLGAAILAGAAMALVGWSLLQLDIVVRAAAAVLAYVACLWLLGSLKVADVRALVASLRRRQA